MSPAFLDLRTPFEDFVDDVNDRMDPRHLASEDEVLDVWALGSRNPAEAAEHIELRRAHRGPAPKMSLGEFLTGILIVPAGIALVCLISLMDEAEAHTLPVASRNEVLLSGCLTLAVGIAVGFALGWIAKPSRRPAAAPADLVCTDHTDIRELRLVSSQGR